MAKSRAMLLTSSESFSRFASICICLTEFLIQTPFTISFLILVFGKGRGHDSFGDLWRARLRRWRPNRLGRHRHFSSNARGHNHWRHRWLVSTLFALPGNYIFLSALKLDIRGSLNAIDFRQPFIFATSGIFFSISCVCPSFHVDSQAVYMKLTWKQGHAHENAEKGSRGHRDFWLVEFSSIE